MRLSRLFAKAISSACGVVEQPLYARRILSTAGLCLPDFLGIGAQKAGTTWLYESLRCHPDLYLPDQKELHYFDRRFRHSLRSYSAHFEPGTHKVKGEITPAYGILAPNRIRFIRTLMPEVRLIFLMRNPIERAWSHAVMELATRPNRRIDEVGERDFYDHFVAAPSMQRGDYPRILSNWLSVFAPEQLCVVFFEDIAARPQELLSHIFSHLGVSSSVDWHRFPYARVIRPQVGQRRDSAGAVCEMPQEFRDFLQQMYRRDIDELHKRFGTAIAGWR